MTLAYTVKSSKAEPAVYIFNNGKEGFIIAPADDRLIPVLGYSDAGSFDKENHPDGLEFLLNEYAKVVENLNNGIKYTITESGKKTSIPVTSNFSTEIAPLLGKIEWDQGSPYNMYCPEYKAGSKSVTGCVATAMAQVMFYHKWPQESSKNLSDYTTEGGIKVTAPVGGGRKYKWSSMKNNYATLNFPSPVAEKAVGELMLDCGISVFMEYGSVSGAASMNIPSALINNFGYAKTAEFLFRSFYTAKEWDAILKNELNNARPVLLSGQGSSGGHEFVCDGYDAGGLYHINWGWSGMSNGYFSINNLNPYEQGIGGNTGDGFNIYLDAVIGIQPSTASDEKAKSTIYITIPASGANPLTVEYNPENRTATLTAIMFNSSTSTATFEYCYVAEDENNNIIATSKHKPERHTFSYGSGIRAYWDLDVNIFNKKGIRIHIESRLANTEEWSVVPSLGCSNYIVSTDNKLTFKPEQKLAITELTLPDRIFTNSVVNAKVSLKGLKEYYGSIIPWFSNNQKPAGDERSLFLNQGETIKMDIPVTIPSRAGTYSLELVGSDMSSILDVNGEAISRTFEVREPQKGDINVEITSISAEQEPNSTIIGVKFTLKNTTEFLGEKKLAVLIVDDENHGVWGVLNQAFKLNPFEEKSFSVRINVGEDFQAGEYNVNFSTGLDLDTVDAGILYPGARVTYNQTTGIEDINNENILKGSDIFDIQGRKITSTTTRGLFIQNGKKLISK